MKSFFSLISTAVVLCVGLFTTAAFAAPASLDLTFGSNGLVATRFGNHPSFPFGRAMAIQNDGTIVVVGEGIMVDALDNELVVGAIVRYTTDGSVAGAVLTAVVGFEGFDPQEWQPAAVVVQPDGKFVVAGEGGFGLVFSDDSGTVLVRYNADGSIDRNFARFAQLKYDDQDVFSGNLSDNGVTPARAGMVVIGRGFCATGLARQPADGKLVVGGCEGGLARLNADGSPDLSFGPVGDARTFVPALAGSSGGFALQGDGKIVMAGPTNVANFTVARVTATGAADTSFGGPTGVVSTELGLRVCTPGPFCEPAGGARAVMIQADGKIVVAGNALVSTVIPGRLGLGLARFNSNGTLDASFGINGTVTTDFGDWTEARAAMLQGDGKIVIAGMTIPANGCERAFLARYNADGALDDSFGVNGRTSIDFSPKLGGAGCNGAANAVALQSDGKIVSVGSASTLAPAATYIAVARHMGGDAAGANTPTGTNVPVNLNAVTLTFDNVTQAGETTLTTRLTGPPPPTGFQLGNPATYFDITTTATFTGGVTICISYAGIAFVSEPNVRLMHFAGGVGVDVTTSVDTTQDIVCGRTATLSPFAVVERVASVAELIVGLIETVKGRALPPALEARLVSVLQTALANPRYVRLACGVLDGFIRLVQFAVSSGQITAVRADELISQARAIKSALGC
jgi:uncharacterized delta-60 repeat protein